MTEGLEENRGALDIQGVREGKEYGRGKFLEDSGRKAVRKWTFSESEAAYVVPNHGRRDATNLREKRKLGQKLLATGQRIRGLRRHAMMAPIERDPPARTRNWGKIRIWKKMGNRRYSNDKTWYRSRNRGKSQIVLKALLAWKSPGERAQTSTKKILEKRNKTRVQGEHWDEDSKKDTRYY